MAATKLLDERDITERLAGMRGWAMVGKKLHRELDFPDFRSAFAFMTRVALAAEALNHHPSWSNEYNHVTVDLWSHDAGGITERDFRLAEEVDRATGGI